MHAYEGQDPGAVVRPVDMAVAAGAGRILLTCAAAAEAGQTLGHGGWLLAGLVRWAALPAD